ncbi:MAG: MBL fold metallo-hydrolase [Enterobacteriaceae bacterium]
MINRLFLVLWLLCFSPFVLAAAKFSSVDNPGFYKVRLGAYQVIALSDGVTTLPAREILINESSENIEKQLKKMHDDDPVTTSVNAYLVNTGKKLVLFDTGAGSFLGAELGKLIANIKLAGYTPDQIDDIYITHLHADHIGGLIADDAPVFPNATLWVEKSEADYWLNPKNKARASESTRPFFTKAAQILKPYQQKDRLKLFTNPSVGEGITVYHAYGHTPGSVLYKIESQGKILFVVGDLLHVGDIQFEKPNVAIKFDSDPAKAVETRQHYFRQFSEDGDAIAAAHLPFPGIGYVIKNGQGYRWKPLNYGENIQ